MSIAVKHLLLRLHRWAALIFLAPLALLFITGLILSLEPAMQMAYRGAGITDATKLAAILQKFDPAGHARQIVLRSYERSVEVIPGPAGTPVLADLDSGASRSGKGFLAATFDLARRIHIHLFYKDGLIVRICTIMLTAILIIGIFLGLPRAGKHLSALHKCVAWIGLPLLLAIAITGLFMSFNITFGGGGGAPMLMGMRKGTPDLAQSIRDGGAQRDLGNMVWMRTMGPRTMMRYIENGRFQGYFVTPAGLVKTPSNLPRGFHEGLWFGYAGPLINVAGSIAFLFLGISGLMLWLRRQNGRARKINGKSSAQIISGPAQIG